ncbi:MAG: isocitrate/isopropylmalate family dehydrogenase [Nanoarchaeota archaeon]
MTVRKDIVVLPGDGIGPEIMREGLNVLRAVADKYGHEFNCREFPFGAGAYFEHGTCYPHETRTAVFQADSVLKGPVGLDGEGRKALQAKGVRLELETIVAIRRDLDTYANYRPVVLPLSFADFSPLKVERLGTGIDIMMIRELTGGNYFGEKVEGIDTDWAFARDDGVYTRGQVNRIANVAFFEAKKRGSKLTNVSKPNIMAEGRFWDYLVGEMGKKKYPDVPLQNAIVDNVACQLVINPSQFNGVMLLENMQGDIITDQAGGIIGSLGLMPSACFNLETGKGCFEPAHGSAPTIAGKNIANPYSMIGSVAFMLEKSFGLEQEAGDVWNALESVFAKGYRTAELGGVTEGKILSTSEFGLKVVNNILGVVA